MILNTRAWTKSPSNNRGCQSVCSGGIPTNYSKFNTGRYGDLVTVASRNFVYFVDKDEGKLCEWSANERRITREIDIIGGFESAQQLLIDKSLLFTGFHLIDLEKWEVLLSLVSKDEDSTLDDAGWYLGSYSVQSSIDSVDGKFVRVVDTSCEDGNFQLLEIDKCSLATKVLDFPVKSFDAVGGRCVVGVDADKIIKYCLESETIIWSQRFFFSESYGFEHYVKYLVVGGQVVAYSGQGDILSLDVVDGGLLWQRHASDFIGSEVSLDSIVLYKALANDKVIVLSIGGSVQCTLALAIDSGDLLWLEEENFYSEKINHCIAGDLLFTCYAEGEQVPYAVDCFTGEVVWKSNELACGVCKCIAFENYILYMDVYSKGYIFEWDKPYISPKRNKI